MGMEMEGERDRESNISLCVSHPLRVPVSPPILTFPTAVLLLLLLLPHPAPPHNNVVYTHKHTLWNGPKGTERNMVLFIDRARQNARPHVSVAFVAVVGF